MLILHDGIPESHRSDPTWPATFCPGCRRYGRFRAGYEFDHEMRCSRCNIVWVPAAILDYRASLAKTLQGMHGDGI